MALKITGIACLTEEQSAIRHLANTVDALVAELKQAKGGVEKMSHDLRGLVTKAQLQSERARRMLPANIDPNQLPLPTEDAAKTEQA